MAILNTYGLTIGYRNGAVEKKVLSDINLSIEEGNLVCLLGANGRGKSTLLRTLAGSQPPLAGKIEIDGKDLSKIPVHKLAKILGLVYTDKTQAGGLTVKELVELGRQPHTGFLGRLSMEDHEIVEKAMVDAGVMYKCNDFVADLSDGERQKAMIAKVLAQETPIIYLDEPTAFLDVASKIETMRLLHSLTRDLKKTVLLSSHDVSQALLLADKLCIINNEGTMEYGVTEDMVLQGRLSHLFDCEKVLFDADDGLFKSKISYEHKIQVGGNSPLLIHWLKNALCRIGIEPTEEKCENKVIIHTSQDVELQINNNKIDNLKNIAELTAYLSDYISKQ